MWQEFLEAVAVTGPHADSHRRKALFLHLLLKEFRRQIQPSSSPADPLANQEVLLLRLPENLQQNESAQQTHRHRLLRPSKPQQGVRTNSLGSFGKSYETIENFNPFNILIFILEFTLICLIQILIYLCVVQRF